MKGIKTWFWASISPPALAFGESLFPLSASWKRGNGPSRCKGEAVMNNKPIHEIRLGSVKAAVWMNSSAAGTWHSGPPMDSRQRTTRTRQRVERQPPIDRAAFPFQEAP